MKGENGTPVTPDWTPCPGFICGGCSASANLCRVLLAEPVNEPCCGECSHNLAAAGSKPVEVKVWEGDDG